MTLRLAALLVLSFVPSGAAAAQGLQIHAAVTADAPGDTAGMRQVRSEAAPGGPIWVGKVLLDLGERSVETVGLERDESGATLSLWLSSEARSSFADLTARSVGRALAVVRDGRVLTAAVVQSEIPNGLVLVTGLDAAEADRLAAALRRGEAERAPNVARGPVTSPMPAGLPERPPVQFDPPRGVGGESGASAQSVALGFSRSIAARRWTAAAAALHPSALAAAKTDAEAALEWDGGAVLMRDGGRSVAIDAFTALGRRAPARMADVPDRDLVALYFAGLDALGAWGTAVAPRAVAGTVSDGDRTHVVLRVGESASGVSDVAVVTVLRDASGAWGVLLTRAQGF